MTPKAKKNSAEPEPDPLVNELRQRAQELRARASRIESAADLLAGTGRILAAAVGSSKPARRAAKKAAAARAPKAPKAEAKGPRKLRAPHAADEPRKLVGRPPFGQGVLTQTCETNRQRTDLLASLKEQGLERAQGRLAPGTYDVIWKDGVAVVYWRLPAEAAA